MAVSQENQNLSQFAGEIFGGDWTIAEHLNAEHLDAEQRHVVYVLSGTDATQPNVQSYATIGLSDHQLGQDKGGVALGAELVGACHNDCNYFDKGLAGAANLVLNSNAVCKPGTIFANALEGFDDASQMDHFLFAVPSLWDNKLYPLTFKSKIVLWLQAIPISTSEMEFAQEKGAGILGEKLLESNADLMDMNRLPII